MADRNSRQGGEERRRGADMDWERQGGQEGRWRNEHERSFSSEARRDEEGNEGAWQYGSQGSLGDNERWQNQSTYGSRSGYGAESRREGGWQGGAQAGRYGENYGSGRGSPRGDFRGSNTDAGRVQFGRAGQGQGRYGAQGYGQGGYGGYGSQGYGSQSWGGYGSPGSERYSGYGGTTYGYGTSGTPGDRPASSMGSYEGGGYARDRAGYYGRGEEHREGHHGHWGHDNPAWEREMQSAKHARWMGEGYGGPIEGPHFEDREPARGASREMRRPGSQRWPKSYQRSDERIREDIYERLLQDSYIDCSNITVVVETGVVTLQGTVPERHMKHQVENLVDDCSGVKDIENKLRVSQVGGGSGEPGAGMTAAGSVAGSRPSATSGGTATPEPTSNSKKP